MQDTTAPSNPRRDAATKPGVQGETTAWYRLPIVWMVIAGPSIVVVASFITLALAILNPDPVIEAAAPASRSEVPAVQARNHAATPDR